MNIQQHSGFYVIGITGRTNNAQEMSGNVKIGGVWQMFLQPSVVAKIPNKIGVDLIAVYTDYETDHTGHYTYLLGFPTSSAELSLRTLRSNTSRQAVTQSSPPAGDPSGRLSRRSGSASGPSRPKRWEAPAPFTPTSRSTTSAPPTRRTLRSTSTWVFTDVSAMRLSTT